MGEVFKEEAEESNNNPDEASIGDGKQQSPKTAERITKLEKSVQLLELREGISQELWNDIDSLETKFKTLSSQVYSQLSDREGLQAEINELQVALEELQVKEKTEEELGTLRLEAEGSAERQTTIRLCVLGVSVAILMGWLGYVLRETWGGYLTGGVAVACLVKTFARGVWTRTRKTPGGVETEEFKFEIAQEVLKKIQRRKKFQDGSE